MRLFYKQKSNQCVVPCIQDPSVLNKVEKFIEQNLPKILGS